VIVSDPDADPSARVPDIGSNVYWPFVMTVVHPERLRDVRLHRLVDRWLCADYSLVAGEWCYRRIPRRLIVERHLGSGRDVPKDHRFWCIGGKVAFISVNIDLWGEPKGSLHLPDWTPIDASLAFPQPVEPAPLPSRLREMIDVAERLADGLDFIRVDLYQVGDRVIFGELTNYPNSGRGLMRPEATFDALTSGWPPARRGRR